MSTGSSHYEAPQRPKPSPRPPGQIAAGAVRPRNDSSPAYLLVRAGGRRVGLPVNQVIEVIDPGVTYPVPSIEPAMRGVATVRTAILPVVHLGALLDGGSCPDRRTETGVIVALDGCRLCLEVDAAESVLREPGLPVPPGQVLPWAAGVARYDGALVPLLDLTSLAVILSEAKDRPATRADSSLAALAQNDDAQDDTAAEAHP